MHANDASSAERLRENAAAVATLRWRDRAIWATLLLLSAALLVVASSLEPAGAGVGTHTQLGMHPCATLAATGFPCPTCGMTTAFAHAADGRLLAAFATQPAGAVLALLTAMATLVSGYATFAGVAFLPVARRVWTPRLIVALGLILIAAWVYKILSVQGVF